MAPSTRSGKGLSITEVRAHKQALQNGPVNTAGLPALPTELLLEIVSHLPTVPIPCCSKIPLDKTYLARGRLIRTLSQMCKALRRAFLPIAYQRIEVCALESIERRLAGAPSPRKPMNLMVKDKELATELVRQLEIVTVRDPSLARHVRIVNVMIGGYSSDTVVQELFRCLPLFLALNTVQFVGRFGPWFAEFSRDKLSSVVIPSVTKVAFASYARGGVRCFPNARVLMATSTPFFHRLGSLLNGLHNVEDLWGFEMMTYQITTDSGGRPLGDLLKYAPTLHTIRFGVLKTDLTSEEVKYLSHFKNLRRVIFILTATYNDATKQGYFKTSELFTFISVAVDVLKKKPDTSGTPRIILVNDSSNEPLLRLLVSQIDCTYDLDKIMAQKNLE